MTFTLSSSVFTHKETIPSRYTCDDEDVSPPLSWSGAPNGTQSLALIVDDPDAPDPEAPKMTWVHWVLYNIPPETTGLAEAITSATLPPGSRLGTNDWRKIGYGGPCPPIGRHRYFFKLYALDKILPDLGAPTKTALEQAMAGSILAETQLMGDVPTRR